MGWKRVLTEEEVRKVFIPCAWADGGIVPYLGHNSGLLADGAVKQGAAEFRVPNDFFANGTLTGVVIPSAAGNIYFQLLAWYGGDNEGVMTHTDVNPLATEAVLANKFEILSLQPLFLTNLSVGDYVGCWFSRDSSNVLDTINATVYLLGFLFEYD